MKDIKGDKITFFLSKFKQTTVVMLSIIYVLSASLKKRSFHTKCENLIKKPKIGAKTA